MLGHSELDEWVIPKECCVRPYILGLAPIAPHEGLLSGDAGLTPGVPLTLRVTPGHQGEDPFEVQVGLCSMNPC
jgi:hypothetical protein